MNWLGSQLWFQKVVELLWFITCNRWWARRCDTGYKMWGDFKPNCVDLWIYLRFVFNVVHAVQCSRKDRGPTGAAYVRGPEFCVYTPVGNANLLHATGVMVAFLVCTLSQKKHLCQASVAERSGERRKNQLNNKHKLKKKYIIFSPQKCIFPLHYRFILWFLLSASEFVLGTHHRLGENKMNTFHLISFLKTQHDVFKLLGAAKRLEHKDIQFFPVWLKKNPTQYRKALFVPL